MKKTTVVFLVISIAISCATLKLYDSSYEKFYDNLNTIDNTYFWEQFHDGSISNADSIISKLEAKLNADSTDVVANAHLGFAHIWILTEGQRIPNSKINIPYHVNQSYKYFSKAYELNPNDKRILGFLANVQMSHGSILKSDSIQRDGYAKGMKSINDWPEFNKFTMGVAFSRGNPESKFFNDALDWQWSTLEDCYTNSIDKTNPNIKEILSKDMRLHNLGKDRACFNSWIAPHNIEGFFLHMGDMITKKGDFTTAIKIYELAKSSPNYNTWEFKQLLEKRILNVKKNTKTFLDKNEKGLDNLIITNSGMLCMSCHKMSNEDKQLYKNFKWPDYFKEKDIYSLNGLK